MTTNELLVRITLIVLNADAAIKMLDDADGDDASEAVDIDYDAYQEIHRLLRLDGRLGA